MSGLWMCTGIPQSIETSLFSVTLIFLVHVHNTSQLYRFWNLCKLSSKCMLQICCAGICTQVLLARQLVRMCWINSLKFSQILYWGSVLSLMVRWMVCNQTLCCSGQSSVSAFSHHWFVVRWSTSASFNLSGYFPCLVLFSLVKRSKWA